MFRPDARVRLHVKNTVFGCRMSRNHSLATRLMDRMVLTPDGPEDSLSPLLLMASMPIGWESSETDRVARLLVLVTDSIGKARGAEATNTYLRPPTVEVDCRTTATHYCGHQYRAASVSILGTSREGP